MRAWLPGWLGLGLIGFVMFEHRQELVISGNKHAHAYYRVMGVVIVERCMGMCGHRVSGGVGVAQGK